MSVGKGTQDLEAVGCARRQFAPQALTDGLDEVRREVGDIAQGLVLYLAVFAIATTQEVGIVDSALVEASRGGYMHRSKTCCHDPYNTAKKHFMSSTNYTF
jgi:hypothetical protein